VSCRVRGDTAGNSGEGNTNLVGRRALLLSLVVLAIAGPAYSGDRALPWSGGTARVTTFEADGSLIASLLARTDVSIHCLDPTQWRRLGQRQSFDPTLTWGMTPMHWNAELRRAVPEGLSRLSPRACRLADAFRNAPTEMGSRLCRYGTTSQRQQIGECDDWGSKLLAVHVLAHESVHLAGVVDEATADCLAMQLDAFVAVRLGASNAFAQALAREYWLYYYSSQELRYRSPSCRDGRALDLFPDLAGWPTPVVYPTNVAQRIGSLTAAPATVASLAGGS
jgi:hypothetical protein